MASQPMVWSEHATARVRAETSACSRGLIHLNNAGAALPPDAVIETVVGHLQLEQAIGGYEASAATQDEQSLVYQRVAKLIGAQPGEIALVDSATRAWIAAFSAVGLRPGERVITSVCEYSSNFIAYLQAERRLGVRIEVLPNDASGAMSVDRLAETMDDDVAIVAATHVPTNSGAVTPVAEIGAIVKPFRALYLVDACQSVGQLPIDVRAIGCDVLTATGRKFLRGPRGTGFLYVNAERLQELEPVCADLQSAEWVAPDRYELRTDAGRFELWENNVSTRLGLGAAAAYAIDLGVERISLQVRYLAELLRARLQGIPAVRVCDEAKTLCGIVTFTVQGWAPADLADRLRGSSEINIWHVGQDSALLDMRARGLASVARASVHYYNTEEEVVALAEQVDRLSRA